MALEPESKLSGCTNIYKYKDGFHLIYPNICTYSNLQYLIRQKIIDELNKTGDMHHLFQNNNINDILDSAVIEKNNWLMYGSCKPNCEQNKYILTYIFNKDLKNIIDELDSDDLFYLPKILSIRKYTNINQLSVLNNNYTYNDIEKLYVMSNYNKKINTNDIKIAKKLVSMLCQTRTNNYQEWISLGWCLHNIHNNLLETWVEFSKLSDKYKNGECENKWLTFRDTGYTIKSLYSWAKYDNPTEYFNFVLEENKYILKQSLTGNSYDVAKAFYDIYKYDFICSSEKNKEWYEFKNHRWIKCEIGSIMYKLNEDMVLKYLHMNTAYSNLALTANDDEKNNLINLSAQCIKICTKLRNIPFKKHVIEELSGLFYKNNPKFLEKIDENRDLICFENGVYDLKNNIFRDGRPDDYITFSTKINYMPYDNNNDKIIIIEKFFNDILPNIEIQNYVLDLMTSCLQGHTPDEKFHIWTGTGGNGKSLSLMLLMHSLGDYACTLPITMLTTKRPSTTSANPELAKTKGKRLCIFQEPEHNDIFYVGYMKEISGGDKISTRALYKEPIEFIPQFKLILTCNNLPEISANDGGTWRRLRVVEFKMKFVDNPNSEDPLERKKDPKFKEELFNLKEALMSILIKRFQNYKLNGLIEPQDVTLYTQKYQQDSDRYLKFFTDNFTLTNNNNDIININDIWGLWKFWYKEYYNEKTTISLKDLENYILIKYKKNYDIVRKTFIKHKIIYSEKMSINNIISSSQHNNNLDII